jgi:hypothetical protein
VADGFDVCPYLRFHGDYGSGKSRALLTIGYLCYKATICSGATTASPIFRLVDKYHGTLVIDEADFERSDATEEIIKILNQGYMRGAVVLRSQEVARQHEPVAFDVYGPKILATRGAWRDKALESRCLTIAMRGRNREDIPLNVDMERFKQQALEIRDKLTLYRLRNFGKQKIDESMRVSDVEDRINQILLPLASIVQDPLLRAEYPRLVLKLQQQLLSNRTLNVECDIAEAIVSMANRGTVGIKDISTEVNEHLDEKDKVSPAVVGKIIKNRFGFTTIHNRNGNFIEVSEDDVRYLKKKYGLNNTGNDQMKV